MKNRIKSYKITKKWNIMLKETTTPKLIFIDT